MEGTTTGILPSFTIDCWDRTDDDAGIHYALGVCMAQSNERGVIFVSPRPVLSGSVLLQGDADTFEVESLDLLPDGISADEAKLLLSMVFDDMNRGGAYTEDWIWRPIDIDAFSAERFCAQRSKELAVALRLGARGTAIRDHAKVF